MKKFLEKFKERFYGALPVLILLGIPTAISLILFVIMYWDNIKDLSFMNIVTALFAAIGAFNIGIGILLTVSKIIDKKLKTYWIYVYLILTAIGIVALKEIGIDI